MEKIHNLLASIQEKLVDLKGRYEAEIRAKENQIEENNKNIADLSEQIDVIFDEIKKCEEETEKINRDFEAINGIASGLLDAQDEYNLFDKKDLPQKLKEAEAKRNQFLTEVETTVEELNNSLKEIRSSISDLDAANVSLTDLIELLNSTYEQLKEAIELSLENNVLPLTGDMEDLLNNTASITTSQKPTSIIEIKHDDLEKRRETRINNLIDLEKFFTDKQTKHSEKNSEEETVGEDDIIDFDPPFTPPTKVNVFGIAPAPDLDKEEPELDIEAPRTNVVDVEATLKSFDNIDLPTAEMFISRIESQDTDMAKDQLTEEEPTRLIEDIVESNLESEESEELGAIQEPLAGENPELTGEPVPEIQLNPLVEKEYIGLNTAGLSLDQITELKSKVTPIKYAQLTNILSNYGITTDNLKSYYKEFISIEDPQKADSVLNLLRGIRKNNDSGDLDFMLDHILSADPEIVQDNLLRLFSQGQNPLPMPISILTSKYFDNIQALREEEYNIDVLMRQFPVTMTNLPLNEFKDYIASHSERKFDDGEQRVYGGRAA